MPVIDQLREYKEVRRGWLGVRIQKVSDDVADKLSIRPARGALVAGIDDKGPAKPAGIAAGDVITKFDGKDVKEMRDLPRIVAATPIGKEVEVVIVHQGKEETRKVTLGRLEDNEKQASLTPKDTPPDAKPALKKTLGLDVAGLTDSLRKKHKIDEKVKGVVITAVDPSSAAAEKRLLPGMVIAEIDQHPVMSPAEFQSRIDALQKEGKKSAMLTVLSPTGDSTIVVLGLR
jgi:serine protease Do